MRKTRSDSKLLNLPEEQQAQLAEWLLSGMPYHRAKETVSKEFGIEVSLQALSRFWQEVCAAQLVLRRKRAVETAEAVAQEAAQRPGQFDSATIDALKQKAFEICINPQASPEDVRALMSLVLKAQDQQMARERLQLDVQKYQERVAAAKSAIESELGKAKGGGLTPETIEKIEQELKLL